MALFGGWPYLRGPYLRDSTVLNFKDPPLNLLFSEEIETCILSCSLTSGFSLKIFLFPWFTGTSDFCGFGAANPGTSPSNVDLWIPGRGNPGSSSRFLTYFLEDILKLDLHF